MEVYTSEKLKAPKKTASNKPFVQYGHWTPVHDGVFDSIMPICPPNAFKVLMFVIRKTRGWNKRSDKLSQSQIREGTGIKSENTVTESLKWLVRNRMLILVSEFDSKTRTPNEYALNESFELPSENDSDSPSEDEGGTPPEIEGTITIDNNNQEYKEESENKTQGKSVGQKAAMYIYDKVKENYDVDLTDKQFGYYVGAFNRLARRHDLQELRAGADRIIEIFPRYQKLTVEEAIQQSKLAEATEVRDDPTKRTI